MSLGDLFVSMARQNAFANGRIHGVCARLDAHALMEKRTNFFPSLLATLQHIWIVDMYYLDALGGGGRGRAIWDDETKHSTLADLSTAQRGCDRQLIAYIEAFDQESGLDEDVVLARRTGPEPERIGDVLAHLFAHQIHHRGQVHAMLAGTELPPPQLDEWFLRNDRAAAERELAVWLGG